MTTAYPKIVGLTGGIGSGKSTVRQMFHKLGVPGIDADVVAREIHQEPGHPALVEFEQAFPQAMTADGRLSRGSLRQIFAVDAQASQRLKSILQPYVLGRLQQWTAEQRAPYVVWESALIVEAGIAVDRVLVVEADRSVQIARVRERNLDWTVAQIDSILTLQLDGKDCLAHAHDTIYNNGSLQVLASQVETLHQAYLQRWERR